MNFITGQYEMALLDVWGKARRHGGGEGDEYEYEYAYEYDTSDPTGETRPRAVRRVRGSGRTR